MKETFEKILLILLLSMMCICISANERKLRDVLAYTNIINKDSIQGVWYNDEFALVIDINESNFAYIKENTVYCQKDRIYETIWYTIDNRYTVISICDHYFDETVIVLQCKDDTILFYSYQYQKLIQLKRCL